MRDLLRLKLADGLTLKPPAMTRRDVRIPAIPGKAMTVIGIRRCGKTTLLWQILADRLAAGAPREALLLIGLEDDRLAALKVADLAWLLEEYFRQQPSLRDSGSVAVFFDEIQVVPGWERFIRRLIDTERLEIYLAGSSAKLLSREIATSMRGRGFEIRMQPFSFREALRHAGAEPAVPWLDLPKKTRSDIDARLGRYLAAGGFPEAQALDDRDRIQLLRSYVDVVVLRDVIERHGVSNPRPLFWLQRQLLASPAGLFSVKKQFDKLKSMGVAVGKDTLHSYLAHLEDAFLVRTVSMHSSSERQRMVNPRKVYPIDPGLIPLYERSGRANLGHALETAVALELERRGYGIEYLRTSDGWEVDFLATIPGARPLLVQVCAEAQDAGTLDRELRALLAATTDQPRARPQLITLESMPPNADLPEAVKWFPAAQWLLEDSD